MRLVDRLLRRPARARSRWRWLRHSGAIVAGWSLLLAPISGANFGCNTSCDDGDDSGAAPVAYEGGTTNAALTYYESDSWDGVYLEFPPQRTYDLHHGLGRRPAAVLSYVGFTSSPLGTDGSGNISEAAGNEVIIERVDDVLIRVRNDTCETFHLRVVALAPADDVEGANGTGSGGQPSSAEGDGGAAGD